jgi:hypothetical protein
MPELPEHLGLVWRAFNELSAHRSSGFSENPLALQDIFVWMELRRVPDDLREELYEQLIAMDREYMADQRKKADAKSKSGNRRARREIRGE